MLAGFCNTRLSQKHHVRQYTYRKTRVGVLRLKVFVAFGLALSSIALWGGFSSPRALIYNPAAEHASKMTPGSIQNFSKCSCDAKAVGGPLCRRGMSYKKLLRFPDCGVGGVPAMDVCVAQEKARRPFLMNSRMA